MLHLLATSVNRLEVIEIQIELPTEIARSQRRNSSKNVCFLFHCDQINRRAFDDPQAPIKSLSREFPRTIPVKSAKKAVVSLSNEQTFNHAHTWLGILFAAIPKKPGNPVFCDWKVVARKKKEEEEEERRGKEFQMEQFQPPVDHGLIWNKTTGDHGLKVLGTRWRKSRYTLRERERERESVSNKSWPWDETVLVKGSRTSQGSREKDLFGEQTAANKECSRRQRRRGPFFFLIVRRRSRIRYLTMLFDWFL